MEKPTIGILTTATSRYVEYVPQFVASINKNFVPGISKTIYLFCDHPQPGVVNIQTEHENYPLVTLKRFDRFWNNRYKYCHHEFLFHLDIDMTVVEVGDEILSDLIAVKHPYFYNGGGSWEDRESSLAYTIPVKSYYCGGVQGGRNYMEVCSVLRQRIQKDLNNGIVAGWHDESHWNWYLNQPGIEFKELDSSYCYPEDTPIPFPKRIIALKKDDQFLKDVR